MMAIPTRQRAIRTGRPPSTICVLPHSFSKFYCRSESAPFAAGTGCVSDPRAFWDSVMAGLLAIQRQTQQECRVSG